MKEHRPKVNAEGMTYIEIAEYYISQFKAYGVRTQDFCERYRISYSTFTKITNKNYNNNFPLEMAECFTEEARRLGLDHPYLFQQKFAKKAGGIFTPPETIEKLSGDRGKQMIETMQTVIDMIGKISEEGQ